MLVHYSGFILGKNLCSVKEPYVKNLPYFLSTEGLFCHEMLDSYWTSIAQPGTYTPNLFNMCLMGNTQYYIDSFFPVRYNFPPPYTKIKVPNNVLIFHLYNDILTEKVI